MSKVAGPVRNEEAPGRMVKVALRELGSGRRMEVIGVYATCRGAQMEMERRVWKKLDEWVEGNPDAVVAGDLNAETHEALERSERKAKWQDQKLEEMINKHGMTVHAVQRATYRDVSELDHVITGQNARVWGSQVQSGGQGSTKGIMEKYG